MSDIQKFHKAEAEFCKQFKATFVTDLSLQYKDIDAVTAKGNTVSVKDQTWSSGKYGGITVEMELVNPQTGQSIPGNFPTSEAKFYAWRITFNQEVYWMCFKKEVLEAFIEERKHTLPTFQLMAKTQEHNCAEGRVYTQARGFKINLSLLHGLDGVKFIKSIKDF